MIFCPVCNTPARVTETRSEVDYVRRRYLCKARHGFSTREVLVDEYAQLLKAKAIIDQVKEMAHA